MRAATFWLRLLARPAATLRGEAPPTRLLAGAVPVGLLALTWATLCAWLAVDGQAPSRGAPGVDPASHYALQAAALPILLPLQWLVLATTAHATGRRLGGHGGLRPTAVALGASWAGPLLLLLVLPDLVAYAAFGFDALRSLVRVTVPAATLASLAYGTVALRALHGLGTGRAALAALAGLLAQALVAGPIVR